jgi:hypothetical protein
MNHIVVFLFKSCSTIWNITKYAPYGRFWSEMTWVWHLIQAVAGMADRRRVDSARCEGGHGHPRFLTPQRLGGYSRCLPSILWWSRVKKMCLIEHDGNTSGSTASSFQHIPAKKCCKLGESRGISKFLAQMNATRTQTSSQKWWVILYPRNNGWDNGGHIGGWSAGSMPEVKAKSEFIQPQKHKHIPSGKLT